MNALQIWMLGCLIFTFVAFSLCIAVIRLHQYEKMSAKRKRKMYQSNKLSLMHYANSLDDSSPDNEVLHKKNVKTLMEENEGHSLNKYGRHKRGNILEDHYRLTKTTQQHQKCLESTKLDYILLWAFPLTFFIFIGVYITLFVLKVGV